MEEVITFDPINEFQVLETFDFEEDRARPDTLRFFTLEEQLNDYFEMRAPKGRMTRFEMKELAAQVDRIKGAYLETVQLTDTEFSVKPIRKVRMPSWVHPLFDEYALNEYNYLGMWAPLFKEQFTLPNYYPRMITALPKPYRTDPSELSRQISDDTRGYVQHDTAYKSTSGVGNYMRTRSILHEDGTRDIQETPISNTADNLRIKGYVLDPRTLELPNPLPDHAFLASTEMRKVETIEPFDAIYPGVDAILTHAVPVTPDPYGEGMKYLKLYDVKLSEIPWDAWKSRFPPADEQPPIEIAQSVSFPAPADTLPSENLRKVYSLPFRPGIHPRLWLTRQEDAGWMVERMLLSRAGDSGRVPVVPIGEILQSQLPTSTPEECLQYDTFDAFLASGVFRDNTCLPPGVISQERRDLISKGRIAWNDDMETTILKDHMSLLKRFQSAQRDIIVPKYQSIASKGESELRRQIKVILKDPRRLDEDKADAIELLLQDTPPKQRVFLDAEGGFLICEHTLASLKGSLQKDARAFYREWTSVEAGVRVCKSCGEGLADVLVQQDEIDDDGRVVLNYGRLDEPSVRGDAQTDDLTLGLRELRSTFAPDNAAEVILYLILSILQVLPTNEQLLPVLQTVRKMSTSLHKANKGAEFTNRADGIIGLMGAVLLIQMNLLVPRRTFGTRALSMSGFPRDTDDANTKGILDSLIFVLRTTFEAFPTSFKGVVVPFVRSILAKPKDIRKECTAFLTRESVKFKDALSQAKMRNDTAPPEATNVTLSLPLLQLEKLTYAPEETLPQNQETRECSVSKPTSTLVPKYPPVVSQKPLVLDLVASPNASAVGLRVVAQSVPSAISVTDQEVRDRLKLGMPKKIRLPDIKTFLDDATDGHSVEALFQRLLDILALERTFSKSDLVKFQRVSGRISPGPLFRDIMKGYVYELLHAVASQPNVSGLEQVLQAALRTDLTLKCLLTKKSDAEKEQQGLRARERETLKNRLRMMDDTKRELTKTFLDLGIAAYIITAEDRELFSKEVTEEDEPNPLADPAIPEEGVNANRDYEDDAVPFDGTANEMDVDRGDYGDRAVRDYDDYADAAGQFDEGDYGV